MAELVKIEMQGTDTVFTPQAGYLTRIVTMRNGEPAELVKDSAGNYHYLNGISGGSTNFYKCASVDTTNHTWSGKLLTLRQDGYYDIDSTATSGLTYDSTIATPSAGKIYSEDGTIEVAFMPIHTDIPTAHLAFYLNGDSFSDASGWNRGVENRSDKVTLTTYDGFPCFDTNAADSLIKINGLEDHSQGQPALNSWTDRSYSLKMCIASAPSGDALYHVIALMDIYDSSSTMDYLYLQYTASTQKWELHAGNYSFGNFSAEVDITYGTWFHIGYTVAHSSGEAKMYYNGVLAGTGTIDPGSVSYMQGNLVSGDGSYGSGRQFYRYICKVRIYGEYILTATEMLALANEQ